MLLKRTQRARAAGERKGWYVPHPYLMNQWRIAEAPRDFGNQMQADRTALKSFVLCALCRTQFPTGRECEAVPHHPTRC